MALPVYDKDIQIPATVISKRGEVPVRILEGERITVPTFEIVSYPQARFSQIKERRFNLIDRAQQKAKSEIQAAEDFEIIQAVDAASDTAIAGVNPVTIDAGALTKTGLTKAFQEVEKWDLVVTKVLMHANAYSFVRDFGRDQFDPVTQRRALRWLNLAISEKTLLSEEQDNSEERLVKLLESVETVRESFERFAQIMIQSELHGNMQKYSEMDTRQEVAGHKSNSDLEVLMTGLFGHIWTADQKVSPASDSWLN